MTRIFICLSGLFIYACNSDKETDTSQSVTDNDTNSGTDTGGGTTDGTPENGDLNGDGCPEENFIDVSQFDGPGGNYSDPVLSVTCDETHMNVVSNGMPNYEYQAMTPNALGEQDYNWAIPLNPEVASATTEIPLLGTAGIAVNGLPIYGPNEGAFPDPYGDPVYNGIMDFCMGHTGGNDDYHYHALLVECFTNATRTETDPSPVIGYSLDGFPIYGPIGCVNEDCSEVQTFKSSWEVTGDPTTYAWDNYDCTMDSCDEASGEYLDKCNGRTGPDGTYRYHATSDFPYILGCYRGTAEGTGQGAPGGDQGGGDQGGIPPECETESDCEGECPEAPLGCTCAETPDGTKRCIPKCNTDADCPENPNVNLVCNEDLGICVPG